jgi:hypothetical protein
MTAARLFFWSCLALATLAFVGALVAGATWATRFRDGQDDSARYDELLDEALDAADSGDSAGSKKITERLLAIDPMDPIARANLGRIYKATGDYPRAIAEMKLAISASPELPDPYYDIACYYALSKRKDEAIDWLSRAFDHGFGRREMLGTDADLASLHGDARFEILSRTGKLPNGVPRVRINGPRQVPKNQPFEVTVVVERDVPPSEARPPAGEITVKFEPDSPLVVLHSANEAALTPGDGLATEKLTVRFKVKAGREGIFALPPATVVVAGSKPVESESLALEVIGPDDQAKDDDPGVSP